MFDRVRESHYWPARWPIRWKLTAVSAGLTFAILVFFGLALGQYTASQLRQNFADETKREAEELAQVIENEGVLTPGAPGVALEELLDRRPDGADLTLIANGQRFAHPDSAFLGPLDSASVTRFGTFQVASAEVAYPLPPGQAVAIVRYGRDTTPLDDRIGDLWFSIVAGILGATLLASLAGLILSGRAMRPVASLTSAARDIARTRDPSVSLDEPTGDDEVAELTVTLNEMLAELADARSERIGALRRQREFIADASHELRTPLTSVMANLELLEHDAARGGKADPDTVESALRSSRRMKRLVADLQILARTDSGRAPSMAPCDLSEIVRSVVSELRPVAGDHASVQLSATGGPVVEGSRDDLHRLILNLVDNAIKHTPNGTDVSVSVSTDESGNLAVIEVEDDGPGIPDDLVPRIFDRFVGSAASADRSGSSSTGLGLAIVQAVAREHGGTVEVGRSAEGGASFSVFIPLAGRDFNSDPEETKATGKSGFTER
jgi:two-component system OmpR family sensor kinase